ncbi:fused nickel transport protein NikMN [Methanobrevibacter cuticularis]|uniref:Fused nickel transport protein NikMN n=1 Tax=Methanobrevibacter cuticularis TaxID=47311 RepID=A0A166DE25_9EURY|nr:cobalt transporter CbiM [Methanobrevibacter cuticularis]KZX15494.1 fused nickel transport protein NikMN [Methanobrevibacter cuticularis]
MHIPDGFIPLWQCIIYYIIIIVVGYFAVRWAKTNLQEKQIPLLAVLAAGIFAIQAMNIPIPWGTSGHMVGAAIVAILIGSPFAGFLVLAVVLIIQGLVFGDGGITALGINIFNMGVLGSFIGFYGFKGLRSFISDIPAVFIACFLGVAIPAVAAAIELWVAGTFPLITGLYFMGIYHIIIGIVGEGVISTIVYVAISQVRPDLIALGTRVSNKSF